MGAVNALFVSPDLQGRMRFKQVARSIPELKNAAVSSSLYEAILRLGDKGSGCDVVYLANQYARDVVVGFVEDAKRSSRGRDSAYMMVVPMTEANTLDLADRVFDGADGFLVEPYSVDSVSESVKLALDLKAKRARGRQEVGFELLIKTQIDAIERMANAVKNEKGMLDHSRVLERVKRSIYALPEDLQESYMELLVERFSSIRPPTAEQPRVKASQYRILRKVALV